MVIISHVLIVPYGPLGTEQTDGSWQATFLTAFPWMGIFFLFWLQFHRNLFRSCDLFHNIATLVLITTHREIGHMNTWWKRSTNHIVWLGLNELTYCGNRACIYEEITMPLWFQIIYSMLFWKYKSRVSCQKGPTRHTYAWQIGPFWQDTLEIHLRNPGC